MEENNMKQTYVTLNDGNKIPQFGLGFSMHVESLILYFWYWL